MALQDVNRIDMETGSPSGDRQLWIIALEWAPEREALDFVQLIIKLSNVESYAARLRAEGRRVTVRVQSMGEPPVSALEFLRSRAVTAAVGLPGAERPATGRPAGYPNLPGGAPDIDKLQAANAGLFAAQHHLDGSAESIHGVDRVLEQRRSEGGLGPHDTDEGLEDGDLLVLAGAYVGEVIRREKGGHWTIDPAGAMTAVHLVLGDGTRVNTLGKAGKYLAYGSGESLQFMASTVIAHLGA